jgi:hypothetical protein
MISPPRKPRGWPRRRTQDCFIHKECLPAERPSLDQCGLRNPGCTSRRLDLLTRDDQERYIRCCPSFRLEPAIGGSANQVGRLHFNDLCVQHLENANVCILSNLLVVKYKWTYRLIIYWQFNEWDRSLLTITE